MSKVLSVEVRCVQCNRSFRKRDRPGRGPVSSDIRPFNAKTCSRDCSRKYVKYVRNILSKRKLFHDAQRVQLLPKQM